MLRITCPRLLLTSKSGSAASAVGESMKDDHSLALALSRIDESRLQGAREGPSEGVRTRVAHLEQPAPHQRSRHHA